MIGRPRRLASPSTESIVYLITSTVSARFLRGQLAYLQGEGFEVVVGVGFESELSVEFDEGVEVLNLKFVREISPFRDVMALARTLRLLWVERPQHVNVSTPKAALVGMLAAWILRVPHRVYVVRGLRYEVARGWKRKLLQRIERFVMKRAHVVLFNSSSLRSLAIRDGVAQEQKARVLAGGSGNGIDLSGYGTRDLGGTRSEDRLTIGFVGRLTQDKGVSDAVKVFAALADDYPSLSLLLVGTFEDGDPLSSSTRLQIESDDRIEHLGWVDDVRACYQQMDVLIFPSYREGLPNAPLEAQASGVPVVGYAATGTVDAVVDGATGLLVPVGSLAELTLAMRSLLDDAEKRKKFGAAGQTWVAENFAQQRIWEELAGVYRESIRS